MHLQYLGFPVLNDPLYNHVVFGPSKGKGGVIGKSDDQLIQDLIAIHNAENWLGMDGDRKHSMFNNKDSGEGFSSFGGGGAPSPPADGGGGGEAGGRQRDNNNSKGPVVVAADKGKEDDLVLNGEKGGEDAEAAVQNGTQENVSFFGRAN